MALGRPKKKDRVQTTVQIDKKHLNRMQGVNRSDVINWALDAYYGGVDHEERRFPTEPVATCWKCGTEYGTTPYGITTVFDCPECGTTNKFMWVS